MTMRPARHRRTGQRFQLKRQSARTLRPHRTRTSATPAKRTNSKIGCTEPNGHGAKAASARTTPSIAPCRTRERKVGAAGAAAGDGAGADMEESEGGEATREGRFRSAGELAALRKRHPSKGVAGIDIGEVPVAEHQGFVAVGILQTALRQRQRNRAD